MQYMDDMLNHLENIIVSATQAAASHYDGFISSMNQYHDIIISNRNELHPSEAPEEVSAGEDSAYQDGPDLM